MLMRVHARYVKHRSRDNGSLQSWGRKVVTRPASNKWCFVDAAFPGGSQWRGRTVPTGFLAGKHCINDAWIVLHTGGVGRPAEIGLAHVLASCALPMAFPVVRIDGEYFGDGSMHQLAPISAALHLGADRVLVIGVGSTSHGARGATDANVWPSLAQIAGHMLDAIFIDTLDMDLERLQRVNQTISQISADRRTNDGRGLRTIETLVIKPGRWVDRIAAAHASELPRTMRFLMRRMGVLEPNGARVLSYLLFERGYCRRLMHLGFTDAMTQCNSILSFLGYNNTGALKRTSLLRVVPAD